MTGDTTSGGSPGTPAEAPTSAMASGAPGEPTSIPPGEARADPSTAAFEERETVEEAISDDTTVAGLAPPGGAGPDELSPVFREPGEAPGSE